MHEEISFPQAIDPLVDSRV